MSGSKTTPKETAVLAEIVNKNQDRVLWLSTFVRELRASVDWVKREVRLKFGEVQDSVANLEEKHERFVGAVPAITSKAATAAFGDFVKTSGLVNFPAISDTALKAYNETIKLKEEAERQRILGVQRADLANKNLEDVKGMIASLTHVVQRLNERLSAEESRPTDARIASLVYDVQNLFKSREEYQAAVNKDVSALVRRVTSLEKSKADTLANAMGVKYDANQFIKEEPERVVVGRNEQKFDYMAIPKNQQIVVEGVKNTGDTRILNNVPGLFYGRAEEALIQALPGILRLLFNENFTKAVDEAGFNVNTGSIVDLVQKLVNERTAFSEDDQRIVDAVRNHPALIDPLSEETRRVLKGNLTGYHFEFRVKR